MKPDLSKAALIVVDMQNDFLKAGGFIARRPEFRQFVKSKQPLVDRAIPNVMRLIQAARTSTIPVVFIREAFREDYADACFPYWRVPQCVKEKFVVEGTWGSQIIEELRPQPGDMVVTKKGYGGFTNTPLNTYLRNLDVRTCIVTGVDTSICVDTTVRQGTDLNYYMVVVSDATADSKKEHEAALSTLGNFFADVMMTDELLRMIRSPKKRTSTRR